MEGRRILDTLSYFIMCHFLLEIDFENGRPGGCGRSGSSGLRWLVRGLETVPLSAEKNTAGWAARQTKCENNSSPVGS